MATQGISTRNVKVALELIRLIHEYRRKGCPMAEEYARDLLRQHEEIMKGEELK